MVTGRSRHRSIHHSSQVRFRVTLSLGYLPRGQIAPLAVHPYDSIRGIDFARNSGYNAGMMLRRATVLASLIAYLGVGMCRQACALDFPAPGTSASAVAADSDHCHDETSGSQDRSRHSSAPCCTLGSADAFVLLPAQAAILPAPASFVAFVAVGQVSMIPAVSTSSEFETRAPPGAVPSILARALHGPRPPPSLLAVL